MRFPFRLLFVGWWMAGQSWMVAGQNYPKPSVLVNPVVVTLGGNVTVRCSTTSDPNAEFFLYKAERSWSPLLPQMAKGYEADFIISNATISDAGIYHCLYRVQTVSGLQHSYCSDAVHINVTDPNLSKPSIKMRPEGRHEVGTNVTIECKDPKYGLTFSLHKSKNLTALQTMKAEDDRVKFSLPPLRREDAGSYTCQYHNRENPFVSSEPSDPAQVVVTDTSPNNPMTIIWASVVAGLLLVLILLVLILALCKKRRKCSTVKEGNQPVKRFLEQNAGTGQDDRTDHDGVTYAELNQHALKTEQPASQHAGPESCVYASVANEISRRV